MEVLGLGEGSELQLPAYTTATRDLSRICDLHHSSWQQQILNPLSEAKGRTCVLMNNSHIRFHWVTAGTPSNKYFYTHICNNDMLGSIITTAKRWKFLKCKGQMDKQNVVYHIMEYFSAIKRRFWHMPQHRCILRKLCFVWWASHKRINTVWVYLCEVPRTVKFLEMENRMVVVRCWGMEDGELVFNGYRVSVWEDEKVLELSSSDSCPTMSVLAINVNATELYTWLRWKMLYIFYHSKKAFPVKKNTSHTSFFFFFPMAMPTACGSSCAWDWIQVIASTYPAASAIPDPLTHCTGPALNLHLCRDLSHCNQILNPLCTAGILHIIFLFFCLFRASLGAYGSSQARSRIGDTAAGLHYSHSNLGSEPRLWTTPLPTSTPEQGQGLNPNLHGY